MGRGLRSFESDRYEVDDSPVRGFLQGAVLIWGVAFCGVECVQVTINTRVTSATFFLFPTLLVFSLDVLFSLPGPMSDQWHPGDSFYLPPRNYP